MKAALDKAIIEEIRRELSRQFSPTDLPKKRKRYRPGRLDFAYSNEVAYRVSIQVNDDAKLESEVARIPHHTLAKGNYSLSDPTLFTSIGRTVRSKVRKDRLLVRVLSRVGQNLHNEFVRAIDVPDNCHVSFHGPGVDGDKVTVWATLQPLGLTFACPEIQYHLILTADRHGKYKAKYDVATDHRHATVRSMVYWTTDNPETWSERQWSTEDLPHVTTSALRHIESFVLDRTLPFESVSTSPQARQAMLVLVPFRLAEAAKESCEVPWCRELVDACLLSLSRQQESPKRVLRQLFFQLLQMELTDPRHQTRAYAEYGRLGLRLAGMRRVDETLPYNPVLVYDHHRNGKWNVSGKLSEQDRKTYSWFLEQATLEQVVDLMSLA